MRTPISILTLMCFFFTSICGPMPVNAQEIHLTKPGVMVHLSTPVTPPLLKGIKVHPDNPFRFDFILDTGSRSVDDAHKLKEESNRLIKYFLASLTIPEADLWVNLSPYEKNRIVPESFGQTEMGRDLLAQDYMLKQITASLMYPEDEIGKRFWRRIYEESAKRYGTTNIPVNTFNKVWIVPEKAVVYENAKAGTAYVVESRLKVMLEEDYVASKKVSDTFLKGQSDKKVSDTILHSQIIREVVIPELTKEINEGSNFVQLRQVYSSLILATWYKKKIKDSLLAQVYADKNKVMGLGYMGGGSEQIYQRYLQAFKKGVYNYIKEEPDPITQQSVPRKYFSGGMAFDHAMNVTIKYTGEIAGPINSAMQVTVDMSIANHVELEHSTDQAMSAVLHQSDLPRLYWGNIVQRLIFSLVDRFRTGENIQREDLVTSAQALTQQFTPEATASEKQLFEDVMKGADLKGLGKTRLNVATIMAAFIAQQAIGADTDSQEFTNVYLPRDMGLGYTIEKTLASLKDETREPGIYYLSRDSLEEGVYSRVSNIIENVKAKQKLINALAETPKERRRIFIQYVGREIMEDDLCRPAAKRILKELKELGIIKNNAKLRFVDTGYKTFPIMLQAIIAAASELDAFHIQTEGLVINSSIEAYLDQIDPKKWDAPSQRLASFNPFSKLARPGILGFMEDDNALPHPFRFSKTHKGMVATDAKTQREAYATQIMFGFGAIEYQRLIDELAKNLLAQGVSKLDSKEISQELIAQLVGLTKADQSDDYVRELDIKTDLYFTEFKTVFAGRMNSMQNNIHDVYGYKDFKIKEMNPDILSTILKISEEKYKIDVSFHRSIKEFYPRKEHMNFLSANFKIKNELIFDTISQFKKAPHESKLKSLLFYFKKFGKLINTPRNLFKDSQEKEDTDPAMKSSKTIKNGIIGAIAAAITSSLSGCYTSEAGKNYQNTLERRKEVIPAKEGDHTPLSSAIWDSSIERTDDGHSSEKIRTAQRPIEEKISDKAQIPPDYAAQGINNRRILTNFFRQFPQGAKGLDEEVASRFDHLPPEALQAGLEVLKELLGEEGLSELFSTKQGFYTGGISFMYLFIKEPTELKESLLTVKAGLKQYRYKGINLVSELINILNLSSKSRLNEKIQKLEMIWPGVANESVVKDPLIFFNELKDINLDDLDKVEALELKYPGIKAIMRKFIKDHTDFFPEALNRLVNDVLKDHDSQLTEAFLSLDVDKIKMIVKAKMPEAHQRVMDFERKYSKWKDMEDSSLKHSLMVQAIMDAFVVTLHNFFEADIPAMPAEIMAETYLLILGYSKLGNLTTSKFEINPNDLGGGFQWKSTMTHEIWHHFISPYLKAGGRASFKEAAMSELGADLSWLALYQIMNEQAPIVEAIKSFLKYDESLKFIEERWPFLNYHGVGRGALTALIKAIEKQKGKVDYVALLKSYMNYIQANGHNSRVGVFIQHASIQLGLHEDPYLRRIAKQADQMDRAMKAETVGGIDLTVGNLNLQTQSSNGEISFKIDPAMLEQLQNASGFSPVIIQMQPLTDVKGFLGMKDREKETISV